jgi:hypothetical protein
MNTFANAKGTAGSLAYNVKWREKNVFDELCFIYFYPIKEREKLHPKMYAF